jgi:hypothetical protein
VSAAKQRLALVSPPSCLHRAGRRRRGRGVAPGARRSHRPPPFACDATPSRGEPTPAVRRRDDLGSEGAFGITVSPLLYLNTGPRSCKLLEKGEHLLAPQLLPQNRLPGGVHSVKLENVFRRIHTNSANLFHGRPPLSEIYIDLILAPLVPSGAVHTNRTSTMRARRDHDGANDRVPPWFSRCGGYCCRYWPDRRTSSQLRGASHAGTRSQMV